MSDTRARLEQMDTWSEELVAAMLDVIDAADTLMDSDPDSEAVDESWVGIADALARFREVAGE